MVAKAEASLAQACDVVRIRPELARLALGNETFY
jgi:hypothetical protein